MEQPRHILRGGPIQVAKAFWTGSALDGRRPDKKFVAKIPLELNPQYASPSVAQRSNANSAAPDYDLEGGGGCYLEVQLQGLYRSDAADFVAQCVQGQSDSDDESEDDDDDDDDEGTGAPAADRIDEEAGVAGVESKTDGICTLPSTGSSLASAKKSTASSVLMVAETKAAKATRRLENRAAKLQKAAAQEAARKKSPEEIAAAKAEAETEALLASITVRPPPLRSET